MNTKFIRRARRKLLVRDKAVDLLSKALLIGISLLVCLWMVSGAHAAQPISITGIHGTAQDDGSVAVDFSLSQKISAENVSVEFERNFIQLSLKGVTAYPARTETIKEGSLDKVFTYQYQPDLARARVLLSTQASTIKAKSSWKITGDGVRIVVRGAITAQTATDTVKNKAAAAGATTGNAAETDDDRIVKEILAGKDATAAATAGASNSSASTTKADTIPPITDAKKVEKGEDTALFAPKTGEEKPRESGATRVIASLLLVIGVIGACAVAFRRFALGKGMPFQRQNSVIETIATHGMGPKRSVAVIKVLDQYMVIGMAGDNMNLLANLGSDVKIDKYLDSVGGPGASFHDSLEGALAGVDAKASRTDTAGSPLTHLSAQSFGGALGGALPKAAQIEQGVRSSIKKRLAGFKPL
jgi:flagellar biogenesis protein FliO